MDVTRDPRLRKTRSRRCKMLHGCAAALRRARAAMACMDANRQRPAALGGGSQDGAEEALPQAEIDRVGVDRKKAVGFEPKDVAAGEAHEREITELGPAVVVGAD